MTALGRRLPSAISMSKRLFLAVERSDAACPLPASSARCAAGAECPQRVDSGGRRSAQTTTGLGGNASFAKAASKTSPRRSQTDARPAVHSSVAEAASNFSGSIARAGNGKGISEIRRISWLMQVEDDCQRVRFAAENVTVGLASNGRGLGCGTETVSNLGGHAARRKGRRACASATA
jgi:hypothetical protein